MEVYTEQIKSIIIKCDESYLPLLMVPKSEFLSFFFFFFFFFVFAFVFFVFFFILLFRIIFIWICINWNLYFLDEESSAGLVANLLRRRWAMGYSRKNPNR